MQINSSLNICTYCIFFHCIFSSIALNYIWRWLERRFYQIHAYLYCEKVDRQLLNLFCSRWKWIIYPYMVCQKLIILDIAFSDIIKSNSDITRIECWFVNISFIVQSIIFQFLRSIKFNISRRSENFKLVILVTTREIEFEEWTCYIFMNLQYIQVKLQNYLHKMNGKFVDNLLYAFKKKRF